MPLTASAVYHCVVKHHAERVGLNTPGFCTHALRATAAANALDHQANIARVQE